MTNDEYQELGRKSFTPSDHPADRWRKIHNIKFGDNWDAGYLSPWGFFYTGWLESQSIHTDKRRKDLRVDEFLQELDELRKKYNVGIWRHGGDEDVGFAIEEYEFGIE